MSVSADPRVTMTVPARMVYENLFKARQFNGKGDPKYSIGLVFDPNHPDLAAMKAAAVATARAQWPGADMKDIKFPFLTGEKYVARVQSKAKLRGTEAKLDADIFNGKIFFQARTKNPPNLSGVENGKIVGYEGEAAVARAKGKFYRGSDVLCEFFFHASEPDQGPTVSAYLNDVLATGKGERLAGGAASSAAEKFRGYVGSSSEEDPLSSGGSDFDDEIPF